MTAPFGRRLCKVSREPCFGRLPSLLVAGHWGPEPQAGPVLHARHRGALGAEDHRPYLPRALSVAEAAPALTSARQRDNGE